VLVTAGHETTVNLITSAVRALLTHPDQLALVQAGVHRWDEVVEETLRWASPVSNFLFRFATQDIEVAGTPVRQGEPLLIAYDAIGRDPQQHTARADRFDLTRPVNARHLSFGHGPHACPGSHLARVEAEVALSALFTRFPTLALAVPDQELTASPSLVVNSIQALPVCLNGTLPR
jgi:cytochrome P450